MEPFIRIQNLHKTYFMGRQKVHALAGVNLEISRGSFTVIMGPSGSGKSTLLYLLGGLDRATSGSIKVGGVALETMDENALAVHRRAQVGFIFQSFNLIASMSALENVVFPLRFAGVPAIKRRSRGSDLLRRVGLQDRAFHKPGELSGGQQQRVAIARALVNDPALILADEPTGNLDRSSGYAIMQLLSTLHQEGHTIVVVTHDSRMTRFSTHTIYLLDGCTVSDKEYQASADLSSLESEGITS